MSVEKNFWLLEEELRVARAQLAWAKQHLLSTGISPTLLDLALTNIAYEVRNSIHEIGEAES